MRLDQALKTWGLAPSRAKAKELITTGSVECLVNGHWQVVSSANHLVENRDDVRLLNDLLLKYVSRSGLKLEGALRYLSLDITGLEVLDLGQSTGGFSDCLLQKGAKRVVGVDVGHDQLHKKLLSDPRLVSLEKLNAKHLGQDERARRELSQGIDLCVADLSFISLEKVMPHVSPFLRPNAKLLLLVKPQFELQREQLNKRGVVADPSQYAVVEKKIHALLSGMGFSVSAYFPCEIVGQDGNQEFFVYAHTN